MLNVTHIIIGDKQRKNPIVCYLIVMYHDTLVHIVEVGVCPHSEACPHTLLFAHRIISG